MSMKVLRKASTYKPNDLGHTFQHVPLKVEKVDGKYKVSSDAHLNVAPSIKLSQAEAITDFQQKMFVVQNEGENFESDS